MYTQLIIMHIAFVKKITKKFGIGNNYAIGTFILTA